MVIDGEDRVGALVDYFAKLADAKITVTDAVNAGGVTRAAGVPGVS